MCLSTPYIGNLRKSSSRVVTWSSGLQVNSIGRTMRQKKQKASNSVMLRAIQVGGIVLATIAVAVAIIGSGYLDKYILSNSQVRIISGIGLYNK